MFDGISILGLSQSGLLAIVVLMVLTGRLVPRSQVRDIQKRAEADAETIRQLTEQNGQLLKTVPLVNSVMRALPQVGDEVDSP